MLAALALLAGCVDYQEGLFASIEREERIPESNLPKESSVFGMVKADGKYYVSLGKLYERNVSGGDWDSIGPPPGFSDSLAADIVHDGSTTTTYVAYNDYELNGSGVFELDTATDTWDPAGNLYDGGKQITDLFMVNNELFMAVLDSDRKYDLLHHVAGTTWEWSVEDRGRVIAGTFLPATVTNNPDGLVSPGDYIFLSRKNEVFYGTTLNGNGLGVVSASATPEAAFGSLFEPSEDFGGILFHAATEGLYVSAREGRIYLADLASGTTWTKSTTDGDRPYTGMAFFPQLDGNEPTGGVVVGIQDLQTPDDQTEEGGYYELPGGGVGTIVTPEGNAYGTTDMSETTVIDFFVDTVPTPNALFVLTQGQGLWRGEYGNSSGALFSDPQWTHE